MAITKAQFKTHMQRIVHASTSPGSLANELTEYVYALYSLNGASVSDDNYAAALAARAVVKGNTKHGD